MNDPWDFFDTIYCITLRERPDRRRRAQRQFAAVGLADRVQYVIAERHPHDREQGIFESHLRCLRLGLDAGARRILVFEDDVLFRHFDRAALKAGCRALDDMDDWNGFFLGCLIGASHPTASPALTAINYRCLAHAYALNAPFARRIAATPWQGIPYDELLRRRNGRFFALCPMCAFQGGLGSDNRPMLLTGLRALCGGLPVIQRANELFQRHRAIVVGAHVAVMILALLLFFTWR